MPIHHRQPKQRIAHAGGATNRATCMGYLRFPPAGTTAGLAVKLAGSPPATSSGHRLRRIAAPAMLALLLCPCAAFTLAQGKTHAVNLDQAPAQPLRLVRTIDAGGEPLFSGRFTTLAADPESNKIYVGDAAAGERSTRAQPHRGLRGAGQCLLFARQRQWCDRSLSVKS